MSAEVSTLPAVLLERLSVRIEATTGLHYPEDRWPDLERGLVSAAQEVGQPDLQDYAHSLLRHDLSRTDLDVLAGNLTIGETHFFRDPAIFGQLESKLLPNLIAAGRSQHRRIRIWSAGCASGEEPYSLAILLHRLIPDITDWQITVLATDINPRALARAQAGVYSEWSFRNTPRWLKPDYFTAGPPRRHVIASEIKEMVSFSSLNLVDDDYPSVLNNTNAFDLIVCCNVLIYFSRERIATVVRRLGDALVEGGHLMLGAVEASQGRHQTLKELNEPGVALYRREPEGADLVARPLDRAPSHRSRFAIRELPRRSPPVRPRVAAPQVKPSPSAPIENATHLFATGRYREAAAAVAAEAKNDPGAAALQAHCHANLGELTPALATCDHALSLEPTNPSLHFLRAGILREMQRDGEAMLALRKVLYLDPTHALACFVASHLHLRGHRLSEAARLRTRVRQVLAGRDDQDELVDAGGLTVGRLRAMVDAVENQEVQS